MRKKLLFLTLNTFSATGGIEKVCRAAGKALHEIALEAGEKAIVYSMYDQDSDVEEKYFPAATFKGFQGQRVQFIKQGVLEGRKAGVVVLSHINLLLVGYLIKLLSPKTKLVLIAHGIEVWEKLPSLKRRMIKAVDLFLPVSQFTAQKLQSTQGISSQKVQVLNNCLDPFLERKSDPEKERAFRTKYGFSEDDFVLLTITRIKFSEQYKGYDKVIEAMAALKDSHPEVKYLVVGRYDKEEKARLDTIIAETKLEENVVFAGYVTDEDLPAHFGLADVYIMPSTGEGFGIVFIEALFYGKTVIAGNKDGSVDALANGKLGVLIDPLSIEEISRSIKTTLDNKEINLPDQRCVLEKFGFPHYKMSWSTILENIC